MSLVNNRPVAYEALFLGELPYEPQPLEPDIGLSGLWRAHTKKNGGNGIALSTLLEAVPEVVAETLRQHEARSLSDMGSDDEALFCLLEPSATLPVVAGITSQAVAIWEKALYRNNYPSIIADNSNGCESKADQRDRLAHLLARESLIVETASAVLQVLPLWSKDPLQPSKDEKKNLARVLTNWGPRFLAEWMDGTIISNRLREQGEPELEITQWLDTFSPRARKRFAVGNISDPLGALDRVKDNLEQRLTDQAIAERLGWSEEEVKEKIGQGVRKRFAVNNINDPLAALDRVKTNLDLLSDDQAIAERLGWSEEEVKEKIGQGVRTHFAVNNINDPLAALDRVKANLDLLSDQAIAERLGWSEEEVKEKIGQGVRKYFAVSNINDPLGAIERYVQGEITGGGGHGHYHSKAATEEAHAS